MIPDWLEAGGSAGSYFGGGQAWLGNIAIQDIQKKKSREKLISHLLNHHSLTFLIQVAFPNLALLSMVQGSGPGTTTTGLSKALQQSLQAMNGMRLPWCHWCSPFKRCVVCLVLQYTEWAAHVPLQLVHFLQEFHRISKTNGDMSFIPFSSFIQPNGLRDKQQKTSWNDDALIAQVLGLPTSEIPSAETLRSGYRDLAEGRFLGWGEDAAWRGWR